MKGPRGDRQAFETFAARELSLVLGRGRLIGVSWGRMLFGAFSRMSLLSALRNEQAQVIPLCGELIYIGALDPRLSSTHLAGTLASSLGVRAETLLTLSGIHAFHDADSNAMYEPDDSPSYRRIFGGRGGPRGLVYELDTFVTSIGLRDRPLGLGYDELREKVAKGERDDLASLFYGDIGGALLINNGLSEADEKSAREIAQKWTGIREKRIREIAERAARDPVCARRDRAGDRSAPR